MVTNSRRISLVKLEPANEAGGKVPFTRCPITSLFVRFDLNKAIVSNEIVDPRAPEKPDRQFTASSVKGANVLQIDMAGLRALAQKMSCPASRAADFPAVADFKMVDNARYQQKSVIIQCGSAVCRWEFIVSIFAQEPGAVSTVSSETVVLVLVLSLSQRSPVQDYNSSKNGAKKTGNKMLLDHSHPPFGGPEVTVEV